MDMGILRLYRKFYCVSTFGSSSVYTLITPTSFEYDLASPSRIIEIDDNNSFGIEIQDGVNVDTSYKQVEHYINNSN